MAVGLSAHLVHNLLAMLLELALCGKVHIAWKNACCVETLEFFCSNYFMRLTMGPCFANPHAGKAAAFHTRPICSMYAIYP